MNQEQADTVFIVDDMKENIHVPIGYEVCRIELIISKPL